MTLKYGFVTVHTRSCTEEGLLKHPKWRRKGPVKCCWSLRDFRTAKHCHATIHALFLKEQSIACNFDNVHFVRIGILEIFYSCYLQGIRQFLTFIYFIGRLSREDRDSVCVTIVHLRFKTKQKPNEIYFKSVLEL